MENKPLAGRGILVTRPREQADALAAMIQSAGGRAVLFPAMVIDDLTDPAEATRAADRLEEFDLAIFVSPTAVQKGLALVRARRAWPPAVRTAGVGGGTRAELERQGLSGVLAPQTGADSEALLALPELASMAGKKVIVFRGEGGRELLGETLRDRGARVEQVACYRRSPPTQEAGPLLAAFENGGLHAVTSSSSAGLGNLFSILGNKGAQHLRKTPLFVSHPRIALEARRLGAAKIMVAGPGDREMIDTLVAYFKGS